MQQPLFYEEDVPKVKAKKKPAQKKEEPERELQPEPEQETTEKTPTLKQVLAQMDAEETAEIQPEPTIDLEDELEKRGPEKKSVEGLPSKEKWQEEHTTPIANIQKELSKIYKRRSAGTTDCKHRKGNTCLKTGKRIALDYRQLHDRQSQNTIACWERMHCDEYEKREVRLDE